MYLIPENFDPGFLLNKKLEMVCIAAYHISLHFSSDIMIQIEGNVEFSSTKLKDTNQSWRPQFPPDKFLSCIESKIVGSRTEDKRNLIITFENATLVRILSNPLYECFRISYAGNEIIV